MRTRAYVDGFNLFYGCLKRTKLKWLDLNALICLVAKRQSIDRIYYFTARVRARPHDVNMPVRQDAYLRALRTLSNLEIVEGHFLSHVVQMPEVHPDGTPTGRRAMVLKTEEKGSDVALASHLLADAYANRFDEAIVVSNDSDLVTPIRLVIADTRKPVHLLNPHPNPARELQRCATSIRPIRQGPLGAAQFAPMLRDRVGNFTCPADWR